MYYLHPFKRVNTMIIVSDKNIDAAETYLDELDEKEASEISIRFAVEQPYLLLYLQTMSVLEEDDIIEEDDELEDTSDELTDNPLLEELTYYAMLIWKAFESVAGKVPLITEQELEEQSGSSMEELEKILSVSESGSPEAVARQLEKLRQPILVAYLLTTFYGGEADESSSDGQEDTEANYVFLVCMQVIIMLDTKVNGGG